MAGLLSRFTTFLPNATILSNDHNQEFNRIVNLLNGTTTNLKTVLKTSDVGDPPLELDQLSTGPLFEMYQGGILKASFGNDGKLTNDNIIALKELWYARDPNDNNAPNTTTRVFIAPSGTGMRLTKFSIFRRGGSHTAGGNVTWRVVRNGALIGSGVSFNDTNNTVNTEYSEALNQALTAGDWIGINNTAISGTVDERDVSLLVEWEQKLS